MKQFGYLLLSSILFITTSCTSKINHCDNPEIKSALKKALILKMKNWQSNAAYAGLDNFENEVNKIIEDIEIIKTSYKGDNIRYLPNNDNETSSCRCSSLIRFKDHEKYKQKIIAPVTKVKTEEHELNTPYLKLKKEINYIDNNGFLFSYVVIKKKAKSIQVIPQYPLVLQPNIDDVGGLIFNYMNKFKD